MVGMDDDQHTTLEPGDFARVQAELDKPTPPSEHLKRAARSWGEVRPDVVTDEARVAEHRAELDAAVDRQRRIDAGFTLARALGTEAGRQALHGSTWRDGETLTPLNLGGLEQHLPPQDVVQAAAELTASDPSEREAITAAWRSTALVYADPELHAALTRDSHEDGGRVTLPEA